MDTSSKKPTKPEALIDGAHAGPPCRVALLYAGDREARRKETPLNSRFAPVHQGLGALGVEAELAIYHDDFCEEVRQQLLGVDGVLVWVNPIEDGRDRSVLDAMLLDIVASGIFVSTHPGVILKLGTKEVLYSTRHLGWGCDTRAYRSLQQMRRELPEVLAGGNARVLKQYRGNGGNGVWKIELDAGDASPSAGTRVRVRHAKRGCFEEKISLDELFQRCAPYFSGDGRMIDQAYQPRLPEGMVRCYLVHGRVEGFGHQAINALYPAPAGAPPESAPPSSPRLYHPPTLLEFQGLKRKLEEQWVPAMQRLLAIEADQLPVLWDCDFLLGPKSDAGEDSYVLCEINVSCVSPFPDSALPAIAGAMRSQAMAAKRRRTAS